MSKCDCKFSPLCRLIDESLRPYTEPEAVSLTQPQEQDILVALSQVLSQIKLLTRELDSSSASDSDSDKDSVCEDKCSAESNLHCEDRNCLTRILSDLVLLLMVENQFIQHLVGNILVAFSEFLAHSENEWNSFIGFLCDSLKLVIINLLACSGVQLIKRTEESSGCDASSIAVLRHRLKNATWSAAAGVIRVLRNIWKWLKQDSDIELLQVYLDHFGSFLQNMPWDFVDKVLHDQSSDNSDTVAENHCFTDALFAASVGQKNAMVVFLGNFIQLLCSLVEQCNATEARVSSKDEHSALGNIIKLVPTLLRWCLGKRGASVKPSISQYFRHKLLMLMLRLSYQIQLGSSTLVSWLQLLYDYFEDILWKPITTLQSGQDECLEGSPFSWSLCEGEIHSSHSLHLQRQAVLLFLGCCFGLISLVGEPNKQCTCAILNSFQAPHSLLQLDCCPKKRGFTELSKWLQRHLSTDMFTDHEIYWERCIRFGSSFLQLFVHEDDALFKVLLQLLIFPSCPEKQLYEEKSSFQDVKDDIVFHISNLFNPVYLLHLFLAELHYDHQVLLDYLISKDTGISCAEYLLRSLRIVCNSWKSFIEFSFDGRSMNESCKKRRISQGSSTIELKALPVPVKGFHPSYKVDDERHFDWRRKLWNSERQSFDKARHCLLSLKGSVKSLKEKNLFPYNPEALLKRLTKFEELCSSIKDYDLL